MRLESMSRWISVQWILAGSAIITVAFGIYKYAYAHDYAFLVETPCIGNRICYVRDCSQGDCPPNELSSYRVFRLPAAQFSSCGHDCARLCSEEHSSCEEILCGTHPDDMCSLDKFLSQ